MGTIGLFLTAILSPCCFPLFAFMATALGLGSFELFGGWTMWVFQAMAGISIIGFFINYRLHRNPAPIIVSAFSGALIVYAYHFYDNDNWYILLYTGMFGILLANAINYLVTKKYNRLKKPVLTSVITCPECKHQKKETMPVNACAFFYVCENCQTRLKPLPGDCCVYCSYGTVKCPPVQAGENCC